MQDVSLCCIPRGLVYERAGVQASACNTEVGMLRALFREQHTAVPRTYYLARGALERPSYRAAAPACSAAAAEQPDSPRSWLVSLRNYERSGIPKDAGTRGGAAWQLSRMHDLLRRLGSPHTALRRVVHVVGSKGKGSTVAMLDAALRASGQRVACYTSPHVLDLEERIAVGAPCALPPHALTRAGLRSAIPC